MADEIKTETAEAVVVEDKAVEKAEAKEPTERELIVKEIKGFLTDKLSKHDRTLQKQLAEVLAASTGAAASIKPEDVTLKAQHEQALAKVAELEKMFNEEKSAREKEVIERLKTEEHSALTEALAANNAVNLRGAMALLREDGKVFRNENGSLMFHGKVKDVPLADGVKEWLASDDGAHYLAPKGAVGTGATAATPKKQATKVSKEEQDAIIAAWLGRSTNGGFSG